MENAFRLRGPSCFVCGVPVSPCPSPAIPPEFFNELVPVVCRSVLLSASHPQFTRQELEIKLKNGEIEPVLGRKSNKLLTMRNKEDGWKEKTHLPPLSGSGTMSRQRSQQSLQKTSSGFFSDLAHLQGQLEKGHVKWWKPTTKPAQIKSSMAPSTSSYLPAKRYFTIINDTTSNRSKAELFPPILDVWAQNDAMQRSITLRI